MPISPGSPLNYDRYLDQSLASTVSLQQRQRFQLDQTRDSLHILESQVALASLDTSHISSVKAELLGKRLLAQAASFAVCPQITTNYPLQVALHRGERSRSAT